ncbi:terminal protein precursor [Aviadenovirus cerasi]|uniref:Terminal protein n=1 Tax=Fowl aviadenovirus 5 TaxID=172861 RepID=A0A6M3Z4Y5_9ADEN|nr:terminal protein precursor [Fowl aviadenovirus 5]
MAAYRVFAELTGQSLNTVRFCEPVITSDFPTVSDQPALVHPRSVFLVSRLYDYRLMQLRDLTPDGPNVAAQPYNGLPPPHLLLGYQYMHRALNDYFFENRVFMQLGYDSSPTTQQTRRLFWTCLTDCSYSVNVGQYMRFLDLDNFHDTFQQMHNAVLMDRIAADMAHVHLRGRGIDVARSGDVVRAASADADAADAAERAQYLSGSGAGGLQDDILMRTASRHDADLLEAIRHLRVALCHYLFCYAHDLFNTENTYRFLPGSDVFAEENWLTLFAEAFAELDTQELIRQAAPDPRDRSGRRDEEPAETMARCFVSTLASRPDTDAAAAAAAAAENASILVGGAIVLRNRRVTDRTGLRPRDRHGRAITASQARRIRRRAVREFVDRLPRVTRRRIRRRQETPAPPGAAPPEEEPRWGEDEEDEEEEERAEKSAASEEETLLDEVIRTALEAIDALQDELTGPARRHELFRFANDFYRLLLRTRDSDVALVTESFLRKWVLYFFVAEHIASTLYYLYSHFIANREFRRYVDVTTLQVLIVGWDVNAQQVFKRIWSEQSNPATIFETLWNRILRDFLMMVERTGQFEGMDEADQQLFLSDIQYRDRSGDIEEVLKQLNLSEELIDSIDISFRIKFRGIVAISTNERITDNLRRVLRHREQDIAIARHVPPRMRT